MPVRGQARRASRTPALALACALALFAAGVTGQDDEGPSGLDANPQFVACLKKERDLRDGKQADPCTELDLSETTLMGEIPDEIGELVHLTRLELKKNFLTGTIPDAICKLTGLRTLALFRNRLVGKIPATIGQLSNLEKLGLMENMLTGPIPESISQMRNLERLGLDFNRLSGTLPPSLGNLNKLKTFEAVYNKLKGPIPASYGQWSELLEFAVSNNELTGPIPTEVGNWKKLVVLFMSINSLTGKIPSEIGDLPSLEAPYCELTNPSFEKAVNQFDEPIDEGVLEKCFAMDKTQVVLHHVHAACGMCIRHRCSLWGGNHCAAIAHLKDPQHHQLLKCSCMCCYHQCGRSHESCALASTLEAKSLLDVPVPESLAAHRGQSPLPLVVGVVGLVAAAGLVAFRRRA